MRRVFSVAASLLVVAAVVGWLASMSGTPAGSAFAQMLDQVTNARTAVFETDVEMRGQPRMQIKTMLLEPDWVREEIGEGEHRHVLIFNLQQRKSLALSPATKKAQLRDIADASMQPKNMIEQIRDLRESSAEFLGEEQVDGKNALKYRCDTAAGHFLLWFDPNDKLPLKVVISESGDEADRVVTITLTEFQWDVPLDESLFSLDVPEGYELERKAAARPNLDPKNFITTLKVYVRLNGNEFPEEFNALTFGSMKKFLNDPNLPEKERKANYRRKLAQSLNRPEMERLSDDQWKEQASEVGKVFAQGAVFLHVLSQTHDWHYLGKGVKLGEAEKIVAWWRPKKADDNDDTGGTATVLYGDLHMETKPVAELPASP